MSSTNNHKKHDYADAHHCCGHNHDKQKHNFGCCSGQEPHAIELTDREHKILLNLIKTSPLPLSKFLLTSTKSNHLESVALASVHIIDRMESVEEIRERGEILSSLEDKGLIILDYEHPLENFDYGFYSNSAAYQQLEELVYEGGKKEGFLFDNIRLETGSITLTSLGKSMQL